MECRSIDAILNALQNASVRFLIVGGLAVNVRGYERFTKVLDLVIGPHRITSLPDYVH